MNERRSMTLLAAAMLTACAGPTLDLGESLRDAGRADSGEDASVRDMEDRDGGAHDGGSRDAAAHDAGCRTDGDCTTSSHPHCAVDAGVCAECTENSHCASGLCELKLNLAFSHCESEE